jgi:SET domain.
MGLEKMLASLKTEESLEPKKRGFDHEGHYSSSNYSTIYWLECNTEKRKNSDLFQRCVRAARLLHCLETMTDLFSEFDIENFKYEVGGLLLRHQLNISCNASGVVEYMRTSMQTLGKKSSHLAIGAAVYATGSLLNHSCFPNVLRQCFSGDTQVFYAIRPISAGEQVIYQNTWNILI